VTRSDPIGARSTDASWPDTPEATTASWLTDVLRARHPHLPTIESMTSERIGTGQVGQCVRFRLGYGAAPAADLPTSVVAKFASADPTSREAGKAVRCYVQEVGFYRDLQATVAIRTPACHFAAIDDDEIRHVLILEDMAPATQGDQLAGCTVDQAAAALAELARLHAPRWNDPALARLGWLETPGSERTIGLASVYEALLAGFEQRFGDRVDGETIALCRAIAPTLAARLADTAGPHTIVHRDYRVDNMLLGDGRSAPPVTIVDWQTVGSGLGASDVAYFLGASLPVELRRRHERELLRAYHRDLEHYGVSGYGWNALWRDYRRSTTAGLLMTVVASMIVGATERGDAMFVTMAERHGRHALDLEVHELL